MTQYFLADHTIGKTKNLVRTDPDYVGDYHHAWRAVLQQRMTLVCFRNVLTADDTFTQEILKLVSPPSAATVGFLLTSLWVSQSRSYDFPNTIKMLNVLREHLNLNVFEKYGVNENYTEIGLSVAPHYRGRRIAENILRARFVRVDLVFVTIEIARDLRLFQKTHRRTVRSEDLLHIFLIDDCGTVR